MKKTPPLGKLSPNNLSGYPGAGGDPAVRALPGGRANAGAEDKPESGVLA